jgi:AraC family transcriptional regulator of adaptative response / DNA-3-methyladenine glycosylase II
MLSSARRLGLPSTPRSLADYARRWAPWRSYAGLHLWRSAARRSSGARPPVLALVE